MKDKIQELIDEAKEHTFEKNNYVHQGLGVFSRPSANFQAWIAECEDFILSHYGKESAPWRIFERFQRARLDGNYADEVEKQKDIIVSALTSCLRIPAKSDVKSPIVTKDLDLSKVFIVHGHDALLKTEVARFIEKLKLEPIILHEKASSGKTIIEKIEEHSNVGFGIVLYTPCDFGAVNGKQSDLKPRARQNVIFEHGFLIGKIGRKNVCALVKGNIEKPNDISGVVYISVEDEWKLNLAKELRNSGYEIDMNLVI
ncbi:TIR domain-containing protein [Flavobacterium psychrophilum]|jgi:predicted nucleotide-binding protein|uniref:TIR domain-containing protein n=1 Tax=Flavobacterium psychrophilum TaxID=96345 RepID=UPI000B7C3DFF|nr:nucleotide-binding protein [Flavobacterium psychrophilum]MCB5984759.1 nucleotide-binding protein [Flavobacterium psychrophilum]MCB5995525.1 nucleotide-binding protein [Flavobacterium psychrophilum]MCB5997917.1 nucleotide-binding protein [Flavobacterium psychrophilum]MCB6005505.1 nucleotide-binding protein [Flavobacterium psychrophilum]MCB6007845.1 nucleotide-binding protein [Flavobacterium psychrophilum]